MAVKGTVYLSPLPGELREPERNRILIITSDQEHVSLMGDVYLARENQLTGDVVEISTMDVMLDVTPRTASSDSEVKITHFNDRLDATGLRLDMIANNFELLKDVRVHYETP